MSGTDERPLVRQGRAVLTIVLAVYGYWCLRDPSDYRWIDSLDLAIHETGHLVFGCAGETLALLGGTLLQLILPGAFIVALWRGRPPRGHNSPVVDGAELRQHLGVHPGREGSGAAARRRR